MSRKINLADLYDERYADAAALELEKQREQWLEIKHEQEEDDREEATQ